MAFEHPIPLSLYIHIPWCVRKCPYCDFNSHALRNSELPEKDYIQALMNDLDVQLSRNLNRPLVSIFFGGGTPSLFSPASIEAILVGVKNRLPFAPHCEITLEANPGTVDEDHFIGFHAAGINRLSLGIQSFQDEKLKALGRIHSSERAHSAVAAAKKAGFREINLDIMHGLPGQSVEDALSDLRAAIACNTTHLSWYELTIEPNTFFYSKPPSLPTENILEDVQIQGKIDLINAGFQHYEVSAFAKPGSLCTHNKNYWEFGDYLGIGAGAHSKLTDFTRQNIIRFSQTKHPTHYLEHSLHTPRSLPEKIIEKHDILFEFMLNALRLQNGVTTQLFQERTGLPMQSLEPALQAAREKEWMIDNPLHLCATPIGQRYLNSVIELFLPKQ